ncbi:Rab3 GTPase-activating protein catalytic subunit-domain-containing protein [Coemansia mojavensis]|nr:Rab3 GTPase-activating protein catalytic subunit-domain-containing protein [Coemansia mojavensis]
MADSNDDENFELVDYTAASGWEKFIASIESQLRLWQVDEDKAGNFDLETLHSTCSKLVVDCKQNREDVLIQITSLCTRTARLTYKSSTYALTLSVHPLLAYTHQQTKLDQQFPPIHVPELEADHSQSEPEWAWHPLHRWTNSKMLIYLQYMGEAGWGGSTQNLAGDNYSVSLETAKLLMSSLNMALRNARCQLPVFVPVGDAWRHLYTGRRLTCDEDRKFDCVSLARAPSAYLQLNGLLELFLSSFRITTYPSSINDTSKVELAALHQYKFKNTYSRDWNTRSPDFLYRMGDLNVGPANDPLRVFSLSALFQQAPCHTYIDLQIQGRDRLYLKTATAWMLSANMLAADRERTMLTEALEDAFAAWSQSNDDRHRHLNMAEQMEAHEEVTSDMLIDLFGSSADSHIRPPGLGEDNDSAKEAAVRLNETLAEVYSGQKRPSNIAQIIARMPYGVAVPYGSLLWRLSEIILVATAKRSADFWGAPSIMTFLRLLWAMALKEVRWRWEHNQLLPRIPLAAECTLEKGADTPNADSLAPSERHDDAGTAQAKHDIHLHYALIYQKLEMINCCIERKLDSGETPIVATAASASETDTKEIFDINNTEIGDFEEIKANSPYASDSEGFVSAEDADFDNVDDDASALLVDPASLNGSESALSSSVSVRLPANAVQGSSSMQAEPGANYLGENEAAGRLYPSSSLRLLDSDEPMWIPQIQAHPILTEDMLRERETILMSFGTSTEGAQQRARLQCAELISDMEAFKAANPRCSLADFVRWHSPRDWIVPDGHPEREGHLSARMAEGEGNLWQQLWAEARRVPVERQRLLFDHNMEAEKALHYLEGIPAHSLFAGLLPTMFFIAYERLYRQPIIHRIPMLRERLLELESKLVQNTDWVDADSPAYSSIMDCLENLEVQASRCVSLLGKFPGQYALVEQLVMYGQAMVDNRNAQKVVLKALSKYNILTSQPSNREYVFTLAKHASQQMYVAINDESSIRVVYNRAQTRRGLLT